MTAAFTLLGLRIARADPTTCPPNCDRIPATAWVDPVAIPLSAKYNWPDLAGIATAQQRTRFYFEDVCASPSAPNDPRAYAVAAKATVANPPGQWQLHVQVLHWRGEAWYSGQLAEGVISSASAALHACQVTAPQASPSLTTDEPGGLAAVLSVAGTAPSMVHQYLV
ncbi:MAG TPA: ATPase, partial [Mycobacterium sp.]|nr:ATPase [Mycobacterium sp.]